MTVRTESEQMRMDKESIATAATKVTYGGAGGAVFFGLTANEFAAIGGLCVAVIGVIVQIVFKVLGYIELKRHHAKIENK
jgi:ABC-type proline/glycine betaine transport system permease subunit